MTDTSLGPFTPARGARKGLVRHSAPGMISLSALDAPSSSRPRRAATGVKVPNVMKVYWTTRIPPRIVHARLYVNRDASPGSCR